MAAVYSNSLGLFNLTTKATPTTSDYLALGDAAVTGVPLKQCTIGSLPFTITNNDVNVTGSTQAMVLNTRYVVNYTGGACTLTLPTAATSPQGTWVQVIGGIANTAGFIIALNTSQYITWLGNATTTTSGTLTSPGLLDSITLICIGASGGLIWSVWNSNSLGSWEIQ